MQNKSLARVSNHSSYFFSWFYFFYLSAFQFLRAEILTRCSRPTGLRTTCRCKKKKEKVPKAGKYVNNIKETLVFCPIFQKDPVLHMFFLPSKRFVNYPPRNIVNWMRSP